MAEIPYFLFGLGVTAGAKATLQILYGHARWGDVEEYLRDAGAPAPFVFCSVARIAEIYQGMRKKPTIHADIAALRTAGAVVASVKTVDRYGRERECEGWTLPLRALPTGTSAFCQYRPAGVKGQAVEPASPSRPPPPPPIAAVRGASTAKELLLAISAIWQPLDEAGFANAKLQIYPENLEGQARVERLVAHVMHGSTLDRPAAFEHVVGVCRRFAAVCKANLDKRKWYGMGMFEVEPQGGRLSRWRIVELDAGSGAVVAQETAGARAAMDERATQARSDKEQIEVILELVRRPRAPTEYERLGWDRLPCWLRVLLWVPGEAASAVEAAIAQATGERRELTLRDLCSALNAVAMDPTAIPEHWAGVDG